MIDESLMNFRLAFHKHLVYLHIPLKVILRKFINYLLMFQNWNWSFKKMNGLVPLNQSSNENVVNFHSFKLSKSENIN